MNTIRLWVAAVLAATSMLCAQAPAAVTATGLPDGAPLRIAAEATPTRLVVHVAIDAGWHLHGRDTGGGQPVQLECLPESAFAAAGALQLPMDQNGQITGKQDLVLPLRASGKGTDLHARMRLMVCDALQCLPPIEVALSTAPAAPAQAPLQVLLVTAAADERQKRIAGFLKDRGCKPSVTTWADVGAAACDAADVVLADSPLFGKTAGANVRHFPVTSTPVVAVGFLGTELLKAQKVTMACGYI